MPQGCQPSVLIGLILDIFIVATLVLPAPAHVQRSLVHWACAVMRLVVERSHRHSATAFAAHCTDSDIGPGYR